MVCSKHFASRRHTPHAHAGAHGHSRNDNLLGKSVREISFFKLVRITFSFPRGVLSLFYMGKSKKGGLGRKKGGKAKPVNGKEEK